MGTLTAQINLTEAELKLLQTLVYQECGMFFDERRSHFLKDRLQRRLKVVQLDSFYSYYRLLTSREGRAELALLLENLTVNDKSRHQPERQRTCPVPLSNTKKPISCSAATTSFFAATS